MRRPNAATRPRFADIEIAQVLIELILVDHRAHFRPGVQRIIDNEFLQSISEPFDEGIMDARGHDQARSRRFSGLL